MEPRDNQTAVLRDPNLHRIIRRRSIFGPPYDPDAITDRDGEITRGVYFMFMSAHAMETIELLQKQRINDGNFMSLGTEKDPIMGVQEEPGTFTIPGESVGRRPTASTRSVSCAVGNTCSCRAWRHCDGWPGSTGGRDRGGGHHERPRAYRSESFTVPHPVRAGPDRKDSHVHSLARDRSACAGARPARMPRAEGAAPARLRVQGAGGGEGRPASCTNAANGRGARREAGVESARLHPHTVPGGRPPSRGRSPDAEVAR